MIQLTAVFKPWCVMMCKLISIQCESHCLVVVVAAVIVYRHFVTSVGKAITVIVSAQCAGITPCSSGVLLSNYDAQRNNYAPVRM